MQKFPITDFGVVRKMPHRNAFTTVCGNLTMTFDSLSYAKVLKDHVQDLLHAHSAGDSAELPDGSSQLLGSDIQVKILSSPYSCRERKFSPNSGGGEERPCLVGAKAGEAS